MHCAKFKFAGLIAVLLFLFIAPPALAGDSPISDADKYAWLENAGWFNFKPSHGEVMVHDDHLSG